MPFATNETLRKSIHIAVGVGAFALKWIPWRYAALAAAAFVVINWLLLHRIVGRGVARSGASTRAPARGSSPFRRSSRASPKTTVDAAVER